MYPLIVAAVAVAYLLGGFALLNRGMAHVRANALTDQQYLSMAVTDRSPSMLLPKLLFVATWPIVVCLMIRASFPDKDDMAVAA